MYPRWPIFSFHRTPDSASFSLIPSGGSPIYGSRDCRWISTGVSLGFFSAPRLGGAPRRTRWGPQFSRGGTHPRLRLGVGPLERAEETLRRRQRGEEGLPEADALVEALLPGMDALHSNPQRGGSLRRGLGDQLQLRQPMQRYYNRPLQGGRRWSPAAPTSAGEAPLYRRRRQLPVRSAALHRLERSFRESPPLTTADNPLKQRPELLELGQRLNLTYVHPTVDRTWLTRRQRRLGGRHRYHRPSNPLNGLLEQLWRGCATRHRSSASAWLPFRSGRSHALALLRGSSDFPTSTPVVEDFRRLLRGLQHQPGFDPRRRLPSQCRGVRYFLRKQWSYHAFRCVSRGYRPRLESPCPPLRKSRGTRFSTAQILRGKFPPSALQLGRTLVDRHHRNLGLSRRRYPLQKVQAARWCRRPDYGRRRRRHWLFYDGRWRRLRRRHHPRLGVVPLTGQRYGRRRWCSTGPLWRRGPLRRALQRWRCYGRRRHAWKGDPLRQLRWGYSTAPGVKQFLKLLGRMVSTHRVGLPSEQPLGPPRLLSALSHSPLVSSTAKVVQKNPFKKDAQVEYQTAAACIIFRSSRSRPRSSAMFLWPTPPLFFLDIHAVENSPQQPGWTLLNSQEQSGTWSQRQRRPRRYPRWQLRRGYTPPRRNSHKLRCSRSAGLRWWFRPEELAEAEGRDKPRRVQNNWQLETDKLREYVHSFGSEGRDFEVQQRIYRRQFRYGQPTFNRSRRRAQQRPLRWGLWRLQRQRLIHALGGILRGLPLQLPEQGCLTAAALALRPLLTLIRCCSSRTLSHLLMDCGWSPNHRRGWVRPLPWWREKRLQKWIYHHSQEPLNHRCWGLLTVHTQDGMEHSSHLRTLLLRKQAQQAVRRRTLNLILAPRRNNLRVVVQPLLFKGKHRERVFARSAGEHCQLKGAPRRSNQNKRELYQLAAFRLLRFHKKDRHFRFLRVVFKHYLETLPPHFHSGEQVRRSLWGLLYPFRRRQLARRYPIVELQTVESYSHRPRGARRRSRKHQRPPKRKSYLLKTSVLSYKEHYCKIVLPEENDHCHR